MRATAGPPPLTPPLKGEGNTTEFVARADRKRARSDDALLLVQRFPVHSLGDTLDHRAIAARLCARRATRRRDRDPAHFEVCAAAACGRGLCATVSGHAAADAAFPHLL